MILSRIIYSIWDMRARITNNYSKQILTRIEKAEAGAVFIGSDFIDIANSETVRRNMNRLVEQGIIRRVIRGVFEKPKYSKFLGEYVAVDPDEVAKALARAYQWTIIPCGETALNMLGLSTQVPAVWCYFSDGPYKTYEWDSTRIEFKRRSNKEITGLSYMTALVIQALKTLGKENVTEEIVEKLSMKLSERDKANLMNEGRRSTAWVFDRIREISGEGE